VAHEPRARFLENPFYVLGLTAEATRAEIEAEGQKLLAMLALRMSAAAVYRTPIGEGVRSETLVRTAMAELRDPARRGVHERWAALPAEAVEPLTRESEMTGESVPVVDPLRALGWRR
jgi:hypothetical protein